MAERLIDLVRQHECLYNNELGHYKYGKWRKEAWQNISISMNVPVVECRRKWNLLRNAFVHALSRRYKASKHQGIRVMNRWTYEREMSFLLPFMYKSRSSAFQIDHVNTVNRNEEHSTRNNDSASVDKSIENDDVVANSKLVKLETDDGANDDSELVKLETDDAVNDDSSIEEMECATESICDFEIKMENLFEDNFEGDEIAQQDGDVATQNAPIADIIENVNQMIPSTVVNTAINDNLSHDYSIKTPKNIQKDLTKKPNPQNAAQNIKINQIREKPETIQIMLHKGNIRDKRESQTEKDEIDLLFESMAMAVKMMPKAEQIRVKMDMTRLICDAQMRCELS